MFVASDSSESLCHEGSGEAQRSGHVRSGVSLSPSLRTRCPSGLPTVSIPLPPLARTEVCARCCQELLVAKLFGHLLDRLQFRDLLLVFAGARAVDPFGAAGSENIVCSDS